MTPIDIEADLNTRDETGYVWTFLDATTDPEIIRPGALVVAGTDLVASTCKVVDLVDRPVGTIVHLEVVLPEQGPNGTSQHHI